MTRPLTANAAAHAAAPQAEPINILRIDFGGAVGTRYFSDRALGAGDGSSPLDAEARVASWGAIPRLHVERGHRPVVSGVVLYDADRTLKGWLDEVEFQRKPATIYQYFGGLAENDLQPILVGVVAAPVRWSERDATCALDLADVSARYRKTLGTVITREDFPLVADADEGRIVPLVFGSVARSPVISCQGGAVTELVRDASHYATKLFVKDASRFPQSATIRVRVDDEVIEGSFSGNTFDVAQRGCDIVPNGLTTAARDELSFYDRALSPVDGAYRQYFLRVADPDGNVRYRQILRYSGDARCVEYFPRIVRQDGSVWTIPPGTAYRIASWPRPHRAGAKVVYHDTAYTFIVNDAPSKRVRAIEGRGTFVDWHPLADGDTPYADWQTRGAVREGYLALDPGTYTVNTCDTSVFGPDHPVTTVTFGRHPQEIFKTVEEIVATLDGVEDAGDGTGDLIEDPAWILREILQRFVGVPAEHLDGPSFAQASSDGTQYLRFGFALTELSDSLALTADLAFQARCALLWEDGQVRLRFLRNRLGKAALTLDRANIVEDSLEILQPDHDEVVSEVRGRFREGDREAAVLVRDEAVEAAYGRRVRDLRLWAHNERESAAAVAHFWLARWKEHRQRVALKTFLPALKLQRRDTVALDWAGLFLPGQKARVLEVLHAPGAGDPARMDTIGLMLELPIEAGCATTCETGCETGDESGCTTACETGQETCWQCETACEDACELFCTTQSEMGCISNDAGCGDSCETACQAHCESACESGCEVACQTGCEAECETGCEATCETGCEVSCETGCEISCESGCEVSCQTGCQVACETGCEVSCQTACEATCETACEASCQTGCEASCQIGCETACEIGCETSCETGCETSQEGVCGHCTAQPTTCSVAFEGCMGACYTLCGESPLACANTEPCFWTTTVGNATVEVGVESGGRLVVAGYDVLDFNVYDRTPAGDPCAYTGALDLYSCDGCSPDMACEIVDWS